MPDLNSVPPSPHILAASRQASSNHNWQSQTSAPPAPLSPSLNILPSNQQTVNRTSSIPLPSPPLAGAHTMSASHSIPGQDNTGVGAGPGPLRHPRPLTAAELHSQLEQEQELLVNRLSRDLVMLRAAQNSSVASNASSTSASTSADQTHPSSFTDTHLLSGPGFPLPTTSADRRHHRTSSSASARSLNQSVAASQGSLPAPIPIPQPHSGSAASVLEAARYPRAAPGMSRQNSTASQRSRSRNHSPHPYHTSTSLSSSYTQSHGVLHDYGSGYFPRGYASSNTSVPATPGSELSPGLLPATLRYEETAHYRQELESAKRENETLKRRIKELERALRDRRQSDASRTSGRDRSGSTSTTASVSVSGATGIGGVIGGGTTIAGDRRGERRAIERGVSNLSISGSIGAGVPEDEVKVGESAASAGLPVVAGDQSREAK
ncbi:uncharacterized protein F4812DRAFT_410928 [Daldinia caldariorum]|uniref:uncharacterized protein n=1 Tax=Daldinia caldariorum TaxID=326644 RepID=UPI0020083C5C|nr:uncharacterized protein F4812DRAFT_410928 [Daldinia caldariorum]KAI1472930.1 hypothetical protein F4812DRAFT_410928 [Daldinia caldariorum]